MGSCLAPGKPARPGRFEHTLWQLICASFLYVASIQDCNSATLPLGTNRFRELRIWVDRSVQGRSHNLKKIGEGEGYNEGNGALGTRVLEPNKTWFAPFFIVSWHHSPQCPPALSGPFPATFNLEQTSRSPVVLKLIGCVHSIARLSIPAQIILACFRVL